MKKLPGFFTHVSDKHYKRASINDLKKMKVTILEEVNVTFLIDRIEALEVDATNKEEEISILKSKVKALEEKSGGG